MKSECRIILWSIISILCLSSTIACSDDDDMMVIISNDEDLRLYDYYIDEYGNEGVVAYINESYSQNVAFVISADEVVCEWGPCGLLVFDKDKESIEDNIEQPRFSLVMSQYVTLLGQERFPAFDWCLQKNGDSRLDASSWVLPSEHEFETMLNEVDMDELNQALQNIGGLPLTQSAYWTATEDLEGIIVFPDTETIYDPENWAISITTSGRFFSNKHIWWNKNRPLGVRAIKYIQYEVDFDSKL